MTEMRPPSRSQFEEAVRRTRDVLVRTPLLPLESELAAGRILLKPETLQPVGSFKMRGVYYAVSRLAQAERERGLSTVSAGNTAQALAWTARHFGVAARSIMPDSAPQTKIDAVRALGGEPVLVPVEEVFRFLRERGWEDEPYAFIHPWIDRDVMIGHGTMGLEILQDCPDVETVYVPVGGGGLIGGVGSALKEIAPSVKVIAVEPEGCPSLHASLEAGRPVSVTCETICDGVAVPYMTEELYPLLAKLVDETVLVSDDAVRESIRLLASGSKIIAEPAGALATAAALARPPAGERTSVCIVTGGSIDAAHLAEILSAGHSAGI